MFGEDIHVREHPVPGNRRMFSMTLASGPTVTIVADPDEDSRDLSITSPSLDEPDITVSVSTAEATTLAALLSGVRFLVTQEGDPQPVTAANLRTVTLGSASPALGKRVAELEPPSPGDATVIAVIRDDTPELVEADPHRPCQPGDRLVLVGRPGAMQDLVRYLLG